MRTTDITEFVSNCFEVKMAEPFVGGGASFNERLNQLDTWLELYTTGKYLILLSNVIFANEKDALIFKLKYGE